MNQEVVLQRFFSALISGHRQAARDIVNEMLSGDADAHAVLAELYWPTLEHIQRLHREDQMSRLAHHYSIRLLRTLQDQLQPQLGQAASRDCRVLTICGPDEPEELAGQMVVDLLEAAGYETFFAGGGVANDELVEEIGRLNIDLLVVFGDSASTVPFTRKLIDRLHAIAACPRLQIAVGGGVFNRADGLAAEIGADIWASTPHTLIETIIENPHQRMASDQRTVGRRRQKRAKTSAA